VTSFVTIALGAFDLREKVASVDANDTTFTSSTYVQGVAGVCDEREDAQITRRTDAFELKRRMKRTPEFPQQRLLLLEFVNRELGRGDHALSVFAGLDAPPEAIAEHRAVRLRWEDNVDRLRVHRDRVEASATRARLVTVLDRLNRSRVETETRRVEVGLRKLGGSACDIGPPQPLPVVTLPPPAGGSSSTSSSNLVPPLTAPPDAVPPTPDIVPEPDIVPPQPAPPPETDPGPGREPQVAERFGPDATPPRTRVPPLSPR
jgi:hypothetical protein